MILLGIVLLAGFYMAWAIGANDVANAMGTSVGSGALTLRRAVIIAAVLEFSGAFFFGSHVSETIQKGIIDPNIFMQNPQILAFGMLASLLSAGVWLQLASYLGLPVSTTHSIVGSVIGFGAVIGGFDAINWENVGFIVSSWVISPLAGGIFAYGIFSILRKKIFYTHNPLASAKKLTPVFVFFVILTLSLILIFDGLKNLNLHISFYFGLNICCFIGLLASLLSYFLVKKIKADPHSEFNSVEKIFGYLQILSASLMAFAHGANDVANAIGPLAAAIGILTSGVIAAKASVPTWALGLGGVGIIIGLATWGWRVIETIGKKITELTPTRGFAAEFGAAATILVASRLGMPISTTHTLVGAVIGVGLARGIEALNLGMTRDIILSWIVTIPAGAVLAVGFYYIIHALFG